MNEHVCRIPLKHSSGIPKKKQNPWFVWPLQCPSFPYGDSDKHYSRWNFPFRLSKRTHSPIVGRIAGKAWFQQGWVKNLSGKLTNDVFIVRGKKLHSFNLRKTSLKPWIIVAKTGCDTEHCDCTIGLLGVCSYVGATLLALDDIHRKNAVKN